MSKMKKSTVEKKFDITKELEFWNRFDVKEDAENSVIERFKKIRNEKINKNDAQVIVENIERIIADEKKPVFFLKLFLEIPKKECAIKETLNDVIKNYCKVVFEKNNIDSVYTTSIGKNICCSEDPRDVISEFIDVVESHMKKLDYTKEDILAITYVWLVMACKEYRSYEYWKILIEVEKVFVKKFRTIEDKDIKSCVLKAVPKAIANRSYEKQFLNISYLYNDYEDSVKNLLEKKASLEKKVQSLIEENISQRKKVELLNNEIFELNSSLNALQAECDFMKEELVRKENMVKFEKNKFEQQFIGKEKNLMSEVESVIGLEIEGIEGVANRLPDKERDRILRYIRRIKERITELGGQKNA